MKLRTSILIGVVLASLAIAWRIVNWQTEFAPNLEIVTAATLLGAAYLDRRVAIALPLVVMAASDWIIGNSPILIFTWSAWIILAIAGLVLRRWSNSPSRQILAATGLGLAGSIGFFLYTNFGVWLIGGLYPRTLAGLAYCYLMGVPFYRTMLLGNLIFVPVAFTLAAAARRLAIGARSQTENVIAKEAPKHS